MWDPTVSLPCFSEVIDVSAKGCVTQLWEIFTMIPCASKYLKR